MRHAVLSTLLGLSTTLASCGTDTAHESSRSRGSQKTTERDVSFALADATAMITDLEILTIPVCGGAVQTVTSATNPATKVPVCAADQAKYPRLAKLSITIESGGAPRSYRLDLTNPTTLPAELSISEVRKDGGVFYSIVDKGQQIVGSIEIETAFAESLIDVRYTNTAIMSGVTLEKLSDARLKVGYTGCPTCVRVGGELPVGIAFVEPEAAGASLLDISAAASGDYKVLLTVAKDQGSPEQTDVTLTIKITRSGGVTPSIVESNKVHFDPISEKGKITAWIGNELVGSATLDGTGAQLVTVKGAPGTKVVWKNDRTSATFETVLDGQGDYMIGQTAGHYVRFTTIQISKEGTLGISTEAEVQFVGAYEGKGAIHSFSGPTVPGKTSVHVRNLGKPVVLVLTSYEPIDWTVTMDTDAKLEAIIVSGYNRSKLVSYPLGTPVHTSSYATRATDKFNYFYAYKDDSEPRYKITYSGGSWICTNELDTYLNASLNWPITTSAIKTLTGKAVTGARGDYVGGMFTIDSSNRTAKLPATRESGYCYAGMAGMKL